MAFFARSTPRADVSKREAAGRSSILGASLVSICFGLLVICGVIISVLFVQVKELRTELANWGRRISAAEARLIQVDKIIGQTVANEANMPGASPRNTPVMLSDDDMKVIRAFIKVLPGKPGSKKPTQPGEEISVSSSVPVPESLVGQLPKLRGAHFIVDENGAIVIFGQGSNRADAVISPQ